MNVAQFMNVPLVPPFPLALQLATVTYWSSSMDIIYFNGLVTRLVVVEPRLYQL